jgi:hypothetical protein
VAAYKPTGVDACLQTLQQAAKSKSVPAELVEGALVYLERNHKTGGLVDWPCSSSTWHEPAARYPTSLAHGVEGLVVGGAGTRHHIACAGHECSAL